MNIVALFGAPGGGKGTVAKKIVHEFGYVHLSTGDIFRERSKVHDALGFQIKKLIDAGEYISDTITVKVVKEFIKKNSLAKGFVFDGFPRTASQMPAFDEMCDASHHSKLLFLEVKEDVLIKRLLKRAKIEKRADDASVKIIQRRIETFKDQTFYNVVEYYYVNGLLTKINGNESPAKVWKVVKFCLRDIK